MIKKYTSISRSNFNLIGGEWLTAENNAGESILNFSPEFCWDASGSYRGNFHVLNGTLSNTVSVFDTALGDETTALAQSRSGTLQLRWQEIFPGETAQSYYSRPCRVITDVAPLVDLPVTQSGWLVLRMSLSNNTGCDFAFEDSYLGSVYLKFDWLLLPDLPEAESKSDFLAVATLILDNNNNVEIIQQQFGPGTLWIPLAEPSQSDSTSSSSSHSSSSEDKSSSSLSESASSCSISDSESISDETAYIEVTFFYQETTDSLQPDGSTLKRYGEVALTGGFTAVNPYPENGYTVVLTGTETYDDGEGSGIQTAAATHTMQVFRNDELARWDFYDADALDWAELLDYEDTANDISYSTPVYDFPAASVTDVYPAGTIQVDHYVINGVSEAVPFYVLTSSLTVTFEVKK